MCLDRNFNGNRNVKFLECDYLLVQRCVKLTLVYLTVYHTSHSFLKNKTKHVLPKCCLFQNSRKKLSVFVVLKLEEIKETGISHQKRYKNKEICSFHAFLQLKETAGRVRLRLENSICDSLSIKVSLCLLCLEKRQNPSHIFKPRKDTKEYVPYIIQNYVSQVCTTKHQSTVYGPSEQY